MNLPVHKVKSCFCVIAFVQSCICKFFLFKSYRIWRKKRTFSFSSFSSSTLCIFFLSSNKWIRLWERKLSASEANKTPNCTLVLVWRKRVRKKRREVRLMWCVLFWLLLLVHSVQISFCLSVVCQQQWTDTNRQQGKVNERKRKKRKRERENGQGESITN